MYSRILGVLLCCVFATGAGASGYSEFDAGIASAKRGDSAGALSHMDAALAAPDLDPAFRAPAHFTRARVYSARGQWKEAIAEASAAIAADPKYLMAYEVRTDLYRRASQIDLAIADATAVINAKPYLVDGYYMRADANEARNDFTSAIADWNVVVKLAPDDMNSYLLRGESYSAAQDFPHALDDLNKAIDLNSRSYFGFYERGLLYEAKADYPRARDDLNKAAGIAPTSMDVVFAQGLVAWDSADMPSALKYFQTVRDSSDKRLAPYGALWMAIVTLSHGGSDADVGKTLPAAFDRSSWPAPILNLYSGSWTTEELLKTAAAASPTDRKGQTCEANFYGGEWLVLHGKAPAGKPLIAAAVAGCPRDFNEYAAAASAYRRLP